MASVEETKKFSFVAFVINLIIPMGVGALGSFLTQESVKTWYVTLNKPSFTPPNWAFPTVWTTLFVLMGIASYLVWQKRKQVEHLPRVAAIYAIQLLLNLMWSFFFFYSKQIDAAFYEILALLAMIAVNGYVFYKIDKTAGLLFIPYFLWVSYATVLTFTIMRLN
ncbi:MAG: tryptophan-rich sensory protein [Pedobacter sp.]|nr:MAG: tryptophan-rich sensory protein [Pedobacter sp.]